MGGLDEVRFGRKDPAAGGPGSSSGLGRFLGGMSTWMAVGVIAGGALLGLIATVALGQEPGTVLGVFVALAGIAAACAIQRAKAYLLFPVPALVMFVAAVVAGKVHGGLGSGTAATGIGLAQWIADMFLPGVAATALVVLVGGGRWLLGRQLVTTGGSSLLGGSGAARSNTGRPSTARPNSALSGGPRVSGSRSPRRPANADPAVDDWANDAPFADQQVFKTSMMPVAGKPLAPKPDNRGGGQRPVQGRDQRQDRDQWGEPRTGPRPRPSGGRPNGGGAPAGGSAPRPSFNPGSQGAQGQRPQRRQPPDNWR